VWLGRKCCLVGADFIPPFLLFFLLVFIPFFFFFLLLDFIPDLFLFLLLVGSGCLFFLRSRSFPPLPPSPPVSRRPRLPSPPAPEEARLPSPPAPEEARDLWAEMAAARKLKDNKKNIFIIRFSVLKIFCPVAIAPIFRIMARTNKGLLLNTQPSAESSMRS